MSQVEHTRNALAGRIRKNRLAAIIAALCLLATGVFWYVGHRPRRSFIAMTAGDVLGHRHELALLLQDEAAQHGLDIQLQPSAGSQEALALVSSGVLDAALVQGDLDVHDEKLAEVAALHSEPLHLFVKPELLQGGFAALKGKRLNLSTPESGTRKVALETLRFMGLSNADYRDESRSYEELARLSAEKLPDGIFAVSALPWMMGADLVHQRGYRLMELPFGDALAVRNASLHDMQIPAYTYSVVPPVPERPVHTVAARLMIVANRQTPDSTVRLLLEILFESDFARRTNLPRLNPGDMESARELPLHAGTVQYLNRNDPLITGEIIESVENLRSFLVSAAVAGFLLWRWQVQRRMIGFETYLDGVTEIELEALDLERAGTVDVPQLLRLRRRLTELKSEALEKHAEGVLKGEEQMISFLAHVTDVRSYLESLFAHESRQLGKLPDPAQGDGPPEGRK